MSARKKTDSMSRSPRNQPAPAARRGRRHEPLAPPRPATSQGLGAVALDNPVAAGGWLVMALTGGLIIANALAFQSGSHPAPLFATRDNARAAAPSAPAVTQAQLEREQLVRDVQLELRRLGMYGGLLDGVNGPATERGVRAYQRARGLPETGDINTALLARLAMDTGGASDGLPPLPPLPPETAPGHSSSQPAPSSAQGPEGATGTVRTIRVTPPVPAPSAPRAQPVATPAASGPVPPAPVGGQALSGERARIARLQAALSEMGYGPLDVDGFAGEQTANAIRRFELDRGLAITGVLGPVVEQEIGKVLGRPL